MDARQIPGRLFQLRANVIPQFTGVGRHHHMRWNSPELDVLLVKFPNVIRLVRDENGVGGGLERGMHHGKRCRHFIGARFTVYASVRFFRLLALGSSACGPCLADTTFAERLWSFIASRNATLARSSPERRNTPQL